jgi:hypothetical protein
MCKDHKKLQDGAYIWDGKNGHQWDEAIFFGGSIISNVDVTLSIVFNTEGHDSCPFDCETLFNAFADSKECKLQLFFPNENAGILMSVLSGLKESSLTKYGFIQTDCGRAAMIITKRDL